MSVMKGGVDHAMIDAAYAQTANMQYTQQTRDAWEIILASLEHPALATWEMVEEAIAAFPAGRGWDEFSIFIEEGEGETVEVSSALFKKPCIAQREEFLRLYGEIKKHLSR